MCVREGDRAVERDQEGFASSALPPPRRICTAPVHQCDGVADLSCECGMSWYDWLLWDQCNVY